AGKCGDAHSGKHFMQSRIQGSHIACRPIDCSLFCQLHCQEGIHRSRAGGNKESEMMRIDDLSGLNQQWIAKPSLTLHLLPHRSNSNQDWKSRAMLANRSIADDDKPRIISGYGARFSAYTL